MRNAGHPTDTNDSHPPRTVYKLSVNFSRQTEHDTNNARTLVGASEICDSSSTAQTLRNCDVFIYGRYDHGQAVRSLGPDRITNTDVFPVETLNTECLWIENTSPLANIWWNLHIDRARFHREITDIMRLFGRSSVADRLDHLHELCEDDTEDQPLNLESIRTLAKFILREGWLPRPQIGVTPNGLVTAQWRIQTDGIVVIEFHASDWMRFVGIEGNPQLTGRQFRISLDGSVHEAVDQLFRFLIP